MIHITSKVWYSGTFINVSTHWVNEKDFALFSILCILFLAYTPQNKFYLFLKKSIPLTRVQPAASMTRIDTNFLAKFLPDQLHSHPVFIDHFSFKYCLAFVPLEFHLPPPLPDHFGNWSRSFWIPSLSCNVLLPSFLLFARSVRILLYHSVCVYVCTGTEAENEKSVSLV